MTNELLAEVSILRERCEKYEKSIKALGDDMRIAQKSITTRSL